MELRIDQHPNPTNWLATDHKTKYFGITLLMSWEYCLWFVPAAFDGKSLFDDLIQDSFLICLAATGISLAILRRVLGSDRHLCEHPAVLWIATGVICLGTGVLTMYAAQTDIFWFAYLCSAIIGIAYGPLWILWGETLVRARAEYTKREILPIFGLVLLFSLLAAQLLPGVGSPIFVSLLPLGSALLLAQAMRTTADASYPHLLPAKVAKEATKLILKVCLISATAAAAACFSATIILFEDLGGNLQLITWGVMAGAIIILVVTGGSLLLSSKTHIFELLPWMLAWVVLDCVIYLIDLPINAVAVPMSLAISAVFQIMLIMYTGVLPLRGYTTPATAFGLSGSTLRLGLCVGYAVSISYKQTPDLPDSLVRVTFLVLIVVLMGLCITLVRQEFNVMELVRSPESIEEQEVIFEQITVEFNLSEREKEIVSYLGRGFTAAAVAEKLIISTSTVNTHIQHIYEKMGIHKRSELIKYLNKRG